MSSGPHGSQKKKANHGKVISSKRCCGPSKLQTETQIKGTPEPGQRGMAILWPSCFLQQPPAICRFCLGEEGLPKGWGPPLLPDGGQEEKEQDGGMDLLSTLHSFPTYRGGRSRQMGQQISSQEARLDLELCSVLPGWQHTFPSPVPGSAHRECPQHLRASPGGS